MMKARNKEILVNFYRACQQNDVATVQKHIKVGKNQHDTRGTVAWRNADCNLFHHANNSGCGILCDM